MTPFSVPELWNIVERCPRVTVRRGPDGWQVLARVESRGGAWWRDATPAPYMTEPEALVHAIHAIHRHACPAGYHRAVERSSGQLDLLGRQA